MKAVNRVGRRWLCVAWGALGVIGGAHGETNEQPPAATNREKILLHFILQREFQFELDRLSTADKTLAEIIRSSETTDILQTLSTEKNAQKRRITVLKIGARQSVNNDATKLLDALRAVLRTEKDLWVGLEAARVLALLGDDAGKSVLSAALYGKDGYQTSSGMEIGKAIIPLLLMNYNFPEGIPKHVPNFHGDLEKYIGEIRKTFPNEKPLPQDSAKEKTLPK